MASTTLTAYIPMREVSGLFTTSLIAARTEKKWKPRGGVPFGWVTVGGKRLEVENNPSWWEHFRDLGTRKLGGPLFPTLPEVVTQSQLTAAIASSAAAITAAQDQQAAANAQALEALRQVVEGLTTTAAVPPVVLVRQEVPPPPPPTPFAGQLGETGGGGD